METGHIIFLVFWILFEIALYIRCYPRDEVWSYVDDSLAKLDDNLLDLQQKANEKEVQE